MSTATEQLDVFITGIKPICFLLGATGSGKTELLTNWLNSINTHGEIVHLEISEPMEIAQLEQRVQEVVPIELPNFSSAEQLSHTIEKLEELSEPVLLIIDNAQNLPPLSLASLYQLACYQKPNKLNLHLMIVGHPELQETISNFTDEYYERETITIELLPEDKLDPPIIETPDLDAANDEHHPQDAAPEEEIEFDVTNDLVSSAPPEVEADVIEPEQADTEDYQDEDYAPKSSVFKRHGVKIISLIILVLLLIVLYFYENHLDTAGSQLLEQNHSLVTPEESHTLPTPIKNKPVAIKAVAKKSAPVIKEAVVKTPTAKKVIPKKIITKQAATKKVAVKPTVIKKAAPAAKPAPAIHNGYTIQLLASGNKQAIARFVKKHALSNSTTTRSKQVHGKTFYEVDFGQYPTYSAAQKGVASIPASLKKQVNPWIKSLK